MSADHTGADVLAKALADTGLLMRPSAAADGVPLVWPVYVGHIPKAPDNTVAVYDTSGVKEGRIMRTGATVIKPGWQVRVRGTAKRVVDGKMYAIRHALDAIRRRNVALGEEFYVIMSVTQTGTPLDLGQEVDANRRYTATLNGTITYKEDKS